jgi:hypothetical protein
VLPRAIALLVAKGATTTEATMNRITLEDVFMHLTGRSMRDAHEHAAEARRASMPRRFA